MPEALPDYTGLIKILLQPLLENPDSLTVDCELTAAGKKVWIRVAFADSQKGRVFGRGGRTIQAIRQILNAAALMAGQTLRFDIVETQSSGEAVTLRPTSLGLPIKKTTPSESPIAGPIRKPKPLPPESN